MTQASASLQSVYTPDGKKCVRDLMVRQLSSTSTAAPTAEDSPHWGGFVSRQFSPMSTTPHGDDFAPDSWTEQAESPKAQTHAEPWPPAMPEFQDEVPRLCITMPQLQSELGKWAQWAVRRQEALSDGDREEDAGSTTDSELQDIYADSTEKDAGIEEATWPPLLEQQVDEVPRLCIAMPQLQSSLGKWAQWAVHWEEHRALRPEHIHEGASG